MAIDINVPSQVKTYANLAAFPATGSLKTIFIAEDTNKTYRWTGSVYVEVSAAGATGITIGTTAITSGTVGRVLFEGTGNVVQESANLFWDNTNGRLGIGTSSPLVKLDISGTGELSRFGSSTNYWAFSALYSPVDNKLEMVNGGGVYYRTKLVNNTYDTRLLIGDYQSFLSFGSYSNQQRVTIRDNGNVLINTTTDAGFKLDVNGTARVVTKVVTPILEGVSSGRVDLKYGFGTSTPSSNILSVGYAGEPAILIGSGTTQNSSMIQMNSTTQGFLPPRMTTTQKNAIATPATGLMVYDTTLNLMSVYNGTTWITL